jgi:tRNA (guanine-N7-)-methyltransferase
MEHNLNVEIKYADFESPICWAQIFGNPAPVHIEIGFGKCGFLLQIAAQHPTDNFIGIESSHKYYRKGVAKIQRAGLPNVKLLWGEAFHLLKRYVPDQSVANVYINFPDPWPKRRHAKRRLIQPEVVTLLAEKLDVDGYIDIATDSEPYIVEVQNLFLANTHYHKIYYHASNLLGSIRRYSSDYEEMFLNEGRTIYYAKYQKKLITGL